MATEVATAASAASASGHSCSNALHATWAPIAPSAPNPKFSTPDDRYSTTRPTPDSAYTAPTPRPATRKGVRSVMLRSQPHALFGQPQVFQLGIAGAQATLGNLLKSAAADLHDGPAGVGVVAR